MTDKEMTFKEIIEEVISLLGHFIAFDKADNNTQGLAKAEHVLLL